MEMAVLKSIAGFLNAKGGTLIIGVADNGTPVGRQKDEFADEDKMSLHLINLLRDRVGAQHAINVQPRFDDYQGTRVLVVDCSPSPSPVFVKDAQTERFFVRYGPSTQELTGSTAQEYIRQRF
jgi:predicted HTH transcriptional regulator